MESSRKPVETVVAKKKFALLIGNSKYEDHPNVPPAPDDVEAFKQVLLSHWGFQEQDMTILVDKALFYIEEVVEKFVKEANKAYGAGAAYFFVIYFSGHGVFHNFQTSGLAGMS